MNGKKSNPFFLTFHLVLLLLSVVGIAAMGVEVPKSAWGRWHGQCKTILLKKLVAKKCGKKVELLSSCLALGTPDPCCCWICGDGKGSAKFSLGAEISTMARTIITI